ncbi:hypothetical protein SsS58_03079 [Streptomyces scabiei]|uniref:Uncharacterized protein n=1 Tax=Streptomyces scabiei TaxID=1930 RepID=A0A100JNC3_STRSC|nr:hypothetical protein SsS58_03079 [Streptomyces scabiei]
MLGLGYGLLQGDVFGLSSEDIDYAKGVVHVRRQVQSHKGWLYFTLRYYARFIPEAGRKGRAVIDGLLWSPAAD